MMDRLKTRLGTVTIMCLGLGMNFVTVAQDGEILQERLRVDGQRLEQRIMILAQYGGLPNGGVHRVAYSEADKQGRQYLISLMREAGMSVRMDAAGNIIGRREGQDPKLPVILIGSHSDTVPEGGKYDGALGVLAAIECVQVLEENGFETRHPVEVVVFANEEGGLIGSRGMIGKMTPEALTVVSHSGKTVGEGIAFLGGNPEKLQEAVRSEKDIEVFIELHIEQGGSLENENIDIGVVQGIVGIHWWDVVVEGFANHAGTTPMDNRRDALLTASHLVIAVNRVVTSIPGRQVGTVGRIHAEPGAPNVIPGKVVMSLEIRDLAEEKIQSVFENIAHEARAIEKKFGTKITFSVIDAKSISAPMDERMQKYLEESAKDLGYSYKIMPSGAGHDAQNMAKLVPTGMFFVPSVGGISHSPGEFTRADDMTKGANVMLRTVLKIDAGGLN